MSTSPISLNFETLTEELRNAKRGFGCFLVEGSDDISQVYGYSDVADEYWRIDIEIDASKPTRLILTTRTTRDNGSDRAHLDLASTAISDIMDAVFLQADELGTIVDVDDFEGEGEDYHDAMEEFVEKVDAALES